MMGLQLRYSPSEGVVRSVGDPPNGILAVRYSPKHGYEFMIDSGIDPGALPDSSRGEGTTIREIAAPESGEGVSLVAVVRGSQKDIMTARMVWHTVAVAIHTLVRAHMHQFEPLPIVHGGAFVVQLLEAIDEVVSEGGDDE